MSYHWSLQLYKIGNITTVLKMNSGSSRRLISFSEVTQLVSGQELQIHWFEFLRRQGLFICLFKVFCFVFVLFSVLKTKPWASSILYHQAVLQALRSVDLNLPKPNHLTLSCWQYFSSSTGEILCLPASVSHYLSIISNWNLLIYYH